MMTVTLVLILFAVAGVLAYRHLRDLIDELYDLYDDHIYGGDIDLSGSVGGGSRDEGKTQEK